MSLPNDDLAKVTQLLCLVVKTDHEEPLKGRVEQSSASPTAAQSMPQEGQAPRKGHGFI